MTLRHRPRQAIAANPLHRLPLALAFIGLVALASLPDARGASPVLGWLPLWLVGLPLSSWLVLAAARRHRG
jgi:hypothetical protein